MKCGESTRSNKPSELFRVNDLRIDTDGAINGRTSSLRPYGDETHQSETSYFQGKIASDEIPYFVIPYYSNEDKDKYKKYSRSVGVLIDFSTNNYVYGIVADNNDELKNNTVGEISIYAAWNIKGQLKKKPKIKGIKTEGKYGIILYAKSAPKGGWNANVRKPAALRKKILKQGKRCFKGVGKCLNKE